MAGTDRRARWLQFFDGISLAGVFIGILVGFICFAVISQFFHPDFTSFLRPVLVGGEIKGLEEAEKAAILKLVENGAVITKQDFIENLTGFYTFVVEILLAIIALLGLLGFAYIRTYSYEQAKKEAKEVVQDHFRHPDFDLRVEEKVKTHTERANEIVGRFEASESDYAAVARMLELYQETGFTPGNFESLKNRLLLIEAEISRRDTSESSGQATINFDGL